MRISIYTIVAIDGKDEDPPLYIGSTNNLKRRNCQHKCRCNNPNDKEYNKPLYKYIRDNGGLDNFIMVELVSEEVETKQKALELERMYIKLLGPILNERIPGKYLELGKEQYHKEYNKERYETNQEELKRQMKQYGSVRLNCPHCGISFRRDNKTQHLRSKTHQNNVNNQANT